MAAPSHVHGTAWFSSTPDVHKLLASADDMDLIEGVEEIINYADTTVSTINPGISIVGSMPLCCRLSLMYAASHMLRLKT